MRLWFDYFNWKLGNRKKMPTLSKDGASLRILQCFKGPFVRSRTMREKTDLMNGYWNPKVRGE